VSAGVHPFAGDVSVATRYNDWLFERCRPYLGSVSLDYGAGIGTFTERLAEACERVVAVEPLAEFVAELERRFSTEPRVEVVEGEVAALPDEEAFDSVVCLNVLEHVAADDAALAGLHSRLRPGGHLLLLVPGHAALYGSLDETAGHQRRYDPGPLRAQLERLGFEVLTARRVNPVGALGWLVSARVLRRDEVAEGSFRAFDRLVPALRHLDRVPLPLGLSVWAVARKPRQTLS
jgi:SAM-dependent methyltransferase